MATRCIAQIILRLADNNKHRQTFDHHHYNMVSQQLLALGDTIRIIWVTGSRDLD